MTNKEVTVVIPLHNRFLIADECVMSVINQTYRPIELIIVDDHSDEVFVPKIRSESGFKVEIIRHDENKGPGASRESGRKIARGDFIAYLDSDDLWHPQNLEKQVEVLQMHPEAGMCYCVSTEFSAMPQTSSNKIRKRSNVSFQEFLPNIFNGRPWDTSACLWTREATDKIGPWFSGWTWEDYAYDFKAGCEDILICHNPETLCYHRVDSNNSQLSYTGRRQLMLNRAKSILNMYADLRASKNNNKPIIRDKLLKTIYDNAIHLFYLDEKEAGLELLEILGSFPDFGKKLLVECCKFASPILKSSTLGDTLYRLRTFF